MAKRLEAFSLVYVPPLSTVMAVSASGSSCPDILAIVGKVATTGAVNILAYGFEPKAQTLHILATVTLTGTSETTLVSLDVPVTS